DRNSRRRRRSQSHGRSRQDDPRPPGVGAGPIEIQDHRLLLEKRRTTMAKEKFVVEPHFRLQEWVAEEKGYFKDEGLEYEFRELIQSSDGAHHYKGDKVGAYQSFEKGRKSDVSCACH